MITKSESDQADQAADEHLEAQARHNEGMAMATPVSDVREIGAAVLRELIEDHMNSIRGQKIIVTDVYCGRDGRFYYRSERKFL